MKRIDLHTIPSAAIRITLNGLAALRIWAKQIREFAVRRFPARTVTCIAFGISLSVNIIQARYTQLAYEMQADDRQAVQAERTAERERKAAEVRTPGERVELLRAIEREQDIDEKIRLTFACGLRKTTEIGEGGEPVRRAWEEAERKVKEEFAPLDWLI